ncbi:dynein axonemal intermediate chain 3 [Anthonomus grandis grandis]|uniref:dynein axonemal intermediate chain 3 n=1 Tax=Anthonomus grandis grandis TaxID=2921223 RepID=UPI0021663E1F|nr:dynein axonemal intermediate chain 3 [Anthonomus grandis grandis]
MEKTEEDAEDLHTKMTSPRRRRRRKKKKRNLFDIPGVRKIVLSELTQKIIECVVGENVTSESPWKYVKKELVQDNLELHEESSEFLPLRAEILAYPRNTILIGYIADETQDKDDEFYICVTEEATNVVSQIIEKLRQEQEDRLYYQLYKDIHPWQSMGTEEEVDEAIVKNNRPLIEVEVESQYPIFPEKVIFRIVNAETKRDGYMELKCEEAMNNVYMRRIDSGIQAAPSVMSSEAQTTCSYPRNATTEYSYDVGDTKPMLLQCEPDIIRYASDNMENLSDLLQVNGVINFYANDYDSLIKNMSLTNVKERLSSSKEFAEYLSFLDVNMCKGKMISDISWHQMWSGTIAIAYSDISSNVFYTGPNKEDEVFKAVHTTNLVLIWSFLDPLKPKLILESPREVVRLCFCKFDENVLVGGCNNGQIIIWDIRNKLQKVEEKEVLTTAQQKYRIYMNSLMGWMKNTHDISLVRPAAVSDLRYSHKAAVTGLSWVNPFHEFSRTGNLSEVPLDHNDVPKYSMQLLTTSLDGSVLIWDFKDKPSLKQGGYRPKRSRRLQKKPSGLEVDESPYRILHLNMRPRYRINVLRKDSKKPIAITSGSGGFCKLNYVEAFPELSKKNDIRERVIYKPVLEKPTFEARPVVTLGTAEGDYIEMYWEGQDFDSGEAVNCEQGKFITEAKYHDGPVVSVLKGQGHRISLTAGGKIFAIWRDDLPGRPVLWRRSRQFITRGAFNIFEPYKVTTQSVTGVQTRWIFSMNSKSPIFTQVLSNSFLTVSAIHPFPGEKVIFGIGDEQGAFRLFYVKTMSYGDNLDKAWENFLDREVNRKKLFFAWQDDFNKRNEQYLQKMKEEAEQKAREEAAREASGEEKKEPEKPARKGPQPGKFVEWIAEQRQLKEEARIKAMIINKKQLDTKELEKRRKPLQKLDEENERKKRKQKERLKQGETIFKDTIASLFPDVIKEKPPPPPDPYAGGDPLEDKENCYQEFLDLSVETDAFIQANPLQYDFDFKNLLVASRSKDEHFFRSFGHQKRYEEEKRERRGDGHRSSLDVSQEEFGEGVENPDEEILESLDVVL